MKVNVRRTSKVFANRTGSDVGRHVSDYGHELEFGNFFAPAADAPEQLVRLAELSEEIGLDVVSYPDHPLPVAAPRYLDVAVVCGGADEQGEGGRQRA